MTWDTRLNPMFEEEWNEYQDSLKIIQNISFDRSYYQTNVVPLKIQEIHAFCDASFELFGYAIYL